MIYRRGKYEINHTGHRFGRLASCLNIPGGIYFHGIPRRERVVIDGNKTLEDLVKCSSKTGSSMRILRSFPLEGKPA